MINTLETRAILTRQSVSMGYPVEDTEVLLLDDAGQPTELYGEIAIRSEQLALGYWNQAETTRAVFFADLDGRLFDLVGLNDHVLQNLAMDKHGVVRLRQ